MSDNKLKVGHEDVINAKNNYILKLMEYLQQEGWVSNEYGEWSKGDLSMLTDEEAFYYAANRATR